MNGDHVLAEAEQIVAVESAVAALQDAVRSELVPFIQAAFDQLAERITGLSDRLDKIEQRRPGRLAR